MVALHFERINIHLSELSISDIFGCFFYFLPLYLLLVRSHQAEIIIVKNLIQGRNYMCDEGWNKLFCLSALFVFSLLSLHIE